MGIIRINDSFKEIATKSIDERKRLTLGNEIGDFKRVRLYKNNKGEILIKPLVEVPASELWLYENKEALQSVHKGLKDACDGKLSELDLDDL